jgi:hypothetical protein
MVKVVTAIPSVMTAATLGPLLPRRVALPSPALLLLLANGRSTHQIAERDIAEAALRHETAEPLRAAAMPSPSRRWRAHVQRDAGIADRDAHIAICVAPPRRWSMPGRRNPWGRVVN